MKKLSLKKLAALLVLALPLACTNVALETPSSPDNLDSRSAPASGPVRLVAVLPGISLYANYNDITVHASNLGTPSSRKVLVRYKTPVGWQDQALSLDTHFGTHSLYKGGIPGATAEFALKYQSDAGTWWDNNGGANYKVAYSPTGAYQLGAVGGNIGLETSTMGPDQLSGPNSSLPNYAADLKFFVEPLSANSLVGVKYSINGGPWLQSLGKFLWKADHLPGSRVECWTAYLTGIPNDGKSSIRFALFYQNKDTGKMYWDNNFGKNYQQSAAAPSLLK